METVERAYNYVFYERADARVKDWLFTSSPVQIAVILTTYYVLIKLVLPAYMRDRKPYNLKSIIKWYNIVMIFGNTIVTWGILTSGWTTKYHYGCILTDYTMDPEAVRLLSYMWWTLVLKLMELIETVFFILRKRNRQASFLHVYHHISTVIIMWTGAKYEGGGSASFVPMVNSGVHVIMYTYYLFSSEGSPGVKAFLSKHKKWLTITQMVQFIVIIVFTFPIMLSSCKITKALGFMNYVNIFFVLFLFYKFYKKTYVKKERSKQEPNGANKKN